MFKKMQILLFVLATSIILSLLGCSAAVTDESVLVQETVAHIATTNISGIETQPLDSEVIAGDIAWKIISVVDQGTNLVSVDDFSYKAIIGKFITIKFQVKNNSDENRILYNLNVIDNKGRVYNLCLPAYAYFSPGDYEACAVVDVFSDFEYNFDAPFDVALDSEGLVLEVTDLVNPPVNIAYIDLGL